MISFTVPCVPAHGDFVNVAYDWQIHAEKPLLRTLSFLFKPLFSANDRLAMKQGQASLIRELARRRALAGGNVASPHVNTSTELR